VIIIGRPLFNGACNEDKHVVQIRPGLRRGRIGIWTGSLKGFWGKDWPYFSNASVKVPEVPVPTVFAYIGDNASARNLLQEPILGLA
jgi:hypothetical protein